MIAPAKSLSTDVDGWVIVEGVRHPLWQIGPERLMLRQSIDLSPRPAEVLLSIDGAESRMRVYLPEGSSVSSLFIPYASWKMKPRQKPAKPLAGRARLPVRVPAGGACGARLRPGKRRAVW